MTCAADHEPSPRAVGMPLPFSAAAMPLRLLMPAAWSSAIVGAIFAALDTERAFSAALRARSIVIANLADKDDTSQSGADQIGAGENPIVTQCPVNNPQAKPQRERHEFPKRKIARGVARESLA
jgi:hypothetical protein